MTKLVQEPLYVRPCKHTDKEKRRIGLLQKILLQAACATGRHGACELVHQAGALDEQHSSVTEGVRPYGLTTPRQPRQGHGQAGLVATAAAAAAAAAPAWAHARLPGRPFKALKQRLVSSTMTAPLIVLAAIRHFSLLISSASP